MTRRSPGARAQVLRGRRAPVHRAPALPLAVALALAVLSSLAVAPAAPRPAPAPAATHKREPRIEVPDRPHRPGSLRPRTIAGDLRARLARPPLRGARVGALVVSLRDGRTIFESKPDLPLTPASTMKVMTSAAILVKLGPDWRFRTGFLADAPPADGVIAGNLYVKGACAPDLVVERFPELAEGLRAAGIREIRGDVVADLSYFDGEERPPSGRTAATRILRRPHLRACRQLLLGARDGHAGTPRRRPANVLVEPLSDAVAVVSTARTISSGTTSIRASRTLLRTADGGLRNRIVVSGRISRGAAPWERFLPIERPAAIAISAVRRALVDAGIVVRGVSRIGAAPEGAAPIYILESKPLAEIVRDMNKNSNNFMAEMLQRTLGAESFGLPASRDKGARALADFLRSCGVDPAPLTLTDGSGLSRSNTLTAGALVRVLVRMREDPAFGDSFFDSLPVSGTDGTLRGRMNGSRAGRVRAKTGHIDGVTTLAGYVEGTREGPIAFAFLVNGADHGRSVRAIDELCAILCAP